MLAAERGHYYYPDGRPAYSIIGRNGKERATTVRDARTLNLVPSVTTILQCAARYGLEKWKAQQLLLAALTLPKITDENESDWVERIWRDSKQQAIKAAERGTEIHAAVESFYRGAPEPDDRKFSHWVSAVEKCVMESFGNPDWSTEKSFASPMGYGGKVDLHSAHAVLDFKTKEGDVSDVKTYDEHRMQLAAYAHGLGIPDAACAIVFISRDKPQAVVRVLGIEDMERGSKMFAALLQFWKAANL